MSLSPINLPEYFVYLYILTTYPFMPFSNSSFEMMPSPSASKSGKYLFLFCGKKSLENIDFILVENQSLLNLPTIFASQMMFECFRMMVIVMINTVCPKISFWRKPL